MNAFARDWVSVGGAVHPEQNGVFQHGIVVRGMPGHVHVRRAEPAADGHGAGGLRGVDVGV